MPSFRRALIAAAFFLTILFLLTRSHNDGPLEAASTATKGAQKDRTAGASSAAGAGTAAGAAAGSRAGDDAAKSSGQRPMMDMSSMTLREQLAYQYPYDLTAKFPAYIWQTWRSTPADGEFEFRDQEASWSEQHPGFIHEIITDGVAVSLLRLLYAPLPQVLEAYLALPLPVLRADFFRYLILLARGGIYSDIDTYAIRSALEWVPDNVPRQSVGLVVGIEADPDRDDWAKWYSRRVQFCQWTLQAKPGHPALLEAVARVTEETLRRKRTGELAKVNDRSVIELTGPAVWTDVLFQYFNDPRYFRVGEAKNASRGGSGGQAVVDTIDWRNFTGMEYPRKVGDVVVLPITGFSPGVGQMGAKEYDNPMAMVKHDFEGTWKPESERHIGEDR